MLLIFSAALQLAAAPMVKVPLAVPRAPLRSYISAEDFPAGVPRSAARAVEVTLAVGPDGRVTQCLITASSGSSQIDATTCRLLRSRSRFVPASDAAGNAIASEARATIDWSAITNGNAGAAPRPGDSRITLAPWESVSRLRARFGQIASCQWQNGGIAPPPPSSNACQNPDLAGMALRLAAENKADFNKSEVVVTLRMTGNGIVEPSPETPAALVDLAAQLDVSTDGQVAACRFVRERVRSAAPQRPDCGTIFGGPYIPATRNGQPVASTHRAELRVEAR